MNTISPLDVSENVCEKWSFCKKDSIKYNLKYNATFLPIDPKSDLFSSSFEDIRYDVMFVGSVGKTYQNRVKILCDFNDICQKIGIRTSMHVLYRESGPKRPFEMKSAMGESEYYDLMKKSNAVLDIVEPENEWMTLRPVEALFFHKKLITNNVDLIEEPLYHPDNVFVLGRDDISTLSDFITSPIHQFKEYVYQYYTFELWLERFGLNIK